MNRPEKPPRPPRTLDDELAALEALFDLPGRKRERANATDSANPDQAPPDKPNDKQGNKNKKNYDKEQ